MKHLFYIILLFSLVSCGPDKPKVCESQNKYSKLILKNSRNNCGEKSVIINVKTEIDFIYDELCKSKSKFILNTQGDLWHITIYTDLGNEEIISFTKTVAGTYYFRDKYGTYSNDILAEKIVELTRVECE